MGVYEYLHCANDIQGQEHWFQRRGPRDPRDDPNDEVVEWCIATFGPMEGTGRWSSYERVFFFRDAIDAVEFRMRWG